LNFFLVKEYGITPEESENMLPFEREIYMGQAMKDLEARRRAAINAARGGQWTELGA
jgi:hypothetical protein